MTARPTRTHNIQPLPKPNEICTPDHLCLEVALFFTSEGKAVKSAVVRRNTPRMPCMTLGSCFNHHAQLNRDEPPRIDPDQFHGWRSETDCLGKFGLRRLP